MKKLTHVMAIVILAIFAFGFHKPIKTSTVQEGLEVGNKIPEIVMKNAVGKDISLSSLKGQIVLLDFWAGWCRPCRLENGTVIYVYERYRNSKFKSGQGFTVFSVSLDTDPLNWQNAIKTDKLLWDNHVCDYLGWASPMVQKFGITGIPANYLIDGNGIILAKNLRGEVLETTLKSMIES
jgi:thiol-disulfide isomerase/thioredoxin